MTRKHVLIGLDHTLSGAWNRDMLINIDWDTFHLEGFRDQPITDMVGLVEALGEHGYNVLGLTARPRRFWPLTMAWLTHHNVRLDQVLMRADDDYRPAPEVKVALAADFFGGVDKIQDHVALVIDDQETVTAAFAALCVTTLQCQARRD